MVSQWTAWRPFPKPQRGEHLSAPVGPGVYELRCVKSGESIAFGHSPNVAMTLTQLRAGSFWERWFGRRSQPQREIEYRTMSAATPRVAREHANVLENRRSAFLDRRLAS